MTRHVTPDPAGAWLAVAGERGVLLVAATQASAAGSADALHAALSGAEPEQAILDLLAGDGVSATPDFALVTADGQGLPRHAIVRGDAIVRVADAAVTASGARTWLERDLGAVEAVVLEAAGAVGAAAALPLESGAAWASRIAWTATGASAEPAEPAELAAAAVTASAEPAATASELARVPPPTSTEVVEHTIVEPEEGVGYDHLFEATIVRSVEDAAVRPQAPDEDEASAAAPGSTGPGSTGLGAPGPGDPGPHAPGPARPGVAGPDAAGPRAPAPEAGGDHDDGDHDGETVLSGSIPGRAERPRAGADEIAAQPAVRRFVLVLPDDRREPISGELVLGRAPTARVSEGRVPHLVTLAGDPDISRSHLRVALEGDTVVVTDLHSRNGTSVVLPGKPPQLLRAGEPAAVIPGTVLDLGGESRLRIEEAPGE